MKKLLCSHRGSSLRPVQSLRNCVLALLLVSASRDASACGFMWYDDEGAFVEWPSIGGGIVAAAPCVAAGYVCGLPFKKQEEFAGALGALPFYTVSGAVGAPFCVVKKVFYDGPKAIAERHSQFRARNRQAPPKPEAKS